jgi:DnaK suppressor protein
VIKTPAQKTTSKKSVVKAVPAPSKPAPKKTVPSAKAAPPASAKPAAKKAAVPAPKTPAKAAATPVPRKVTPLKTAASAKTTDKAAKAVPSPAASPAAAVTPKAAATKPAKASRSSAPSAALAPPPPPATSRFADRFAPPRPPTRQMSNLSIETPRPVHVTDPKLANAWKTKPGRDLSEEELQAMPESEYMNDKQLDFFRSRLQIQKDNLLSNAGETTEHLREDTSIVPDPADRATIEEEHALELRTRDRERKLLKKISQSLMRIDSGEYGFCDETGEPIGLGRLIARPTATLSLEAQQRRELKQKMFGD